MSALPMLPLFVDAYLADTSPLTLEEKGAYSDLLCHMWLHEGWLPDNDTVISRLLRIQARTWRKVKQALIPYLVFEGGKISQKRLMKEFLSAVYRQKKNAKNGAKKWEKERNQQKNNDSDNATAYANSDASGICPLSLPSITNVIAAKSPIGDPIKNLWDVGVELLVSKGTSEQQARIFIGKLRKEHDDGDILQAILQAQEKQVVEPKAWIMAYFKTRSRASVCADMMN